MSVNTSKSNGSSKNFSYLINSDCINFVYKYILLSILMFILLIFFTVLLFTARANVMVLFGVNLSMYYLPPFLICLYFVSYSFYRVFFVTSKKLVRHIWVGQELWIELFNGRRVLLEEFEIILDQKKLQYINRDQMGGKVYKKYDFSYIGIESNEMIYLLPYKEESKEFTINLLQDVSMKSH